MISLTLEKTVEEIFNTVCDLLKKLSGLKVPKHRNIAEIYKSMICIL